MFNLSDFKIETKNGIPLVLNTTNIKKALTDNMYDVEDNNGFFVCSLYWSAEEGGLISSHDNTTKAKFIIEEISNLLNKERLINIGFKASSDYLIDENCNLDWHLNDLELVKGSAEADQFIIGWNQAIQD